MKKIAARNVTDVISNEIEALATKYKALEKRIDRSNASIARDQKQKKQNRRSDRLLERRAGNY